MSEQISMRPVGTVRAARAKAEDDAWDRVDSRIELDSAQFGPDCVAGLSEFSHVEVIYHFDKVPPETVCSGARHPRDNADWPKVGIFAQRGKDRPNRIGATICALVSVEGTVLRLRGLDAIDGTPVLDIKPVMKGFLPRGDVREPQWAGELMKGYW